MVHRYKYANVKCKEPGCDFNARCRGYCRLHYGYHHVAGVIVVCIMVIIVEGD